jgi:transcription elongation factor GreA
LTQLKQRRERLQTGLQTAEDTVGDREDAADEIQQAEELAFVERRIAQLEDLLHHGGADAAQAGLLPHGAEVTLRFPDGEVVGMRVISVVAEISTDDETLTADSPLGVALVGHKPGDTVTYTTPRGQQSVELLKVKLPR